MKLFQRYLTVSSIFLMSAFPMLGQQSSKTTGIPGYLDPVTGVFHPKLASAIPDVVALTTYTGELQFEFTIKVVSKVATGQEILCTVTSSLVDIPKQGSSENVITEEASTVAKQSGATATCTVEIPYSWSLANGPLDSVGLSYSIVIAPTSLTNEPDGLTARRSTQQLPPLLAVPAIGSTTTKTISATI